MRLSICFKVILISLSMDSVIVTHNWAWLLCVFPASCSERLDTVALRKLVLFVNDLMEQYFDFVRQRVQLEVSARFLFVDSPFLFFKYESLHFSRWSDIRLFNIVSFKLWS